MATHSSVLAWKKPWTEERGGLQSMGSQRVGHDRATSLSLFFPARALACSSLCRTRSISLHAGYLTFPSVYGLRKGKAGSFTSAPLFLTPPTE